MDWKEYLLQERLMFKQNTADDIAKSALAGISKVMKKKIDAPKTVSFFKDHFKNSIVTAVMPNGNTLKVIKAGRVIKVEFYTKTGSGGTIFLPGKSQDIEKDFIIKAKTSDIDNLKKVF